MTEPPDDTVHINAFVQLHPAAAVVECICGNQLGPEDFMGLTTNHGSGEACMRWWCDKCCYHPYAAMPIGIYTLYRPIYIDGDAKHPEAKGFPCVVLGTLGREHEGGPRIYHISVQTPGYGIELDATHRDFADPIGWELRGTSRWPIDHPYRALAMIQSGRAPDPRIAPTQQA